MGHYYCEMGCVAVAADAPRKFDQEKPRPLLLPVKAERAVCAVLEYGAKKYSDDNWLKVAAEPGGIERYLNAALRHLQEVRGAMRAAGDDAAVRKAALCLDADSGQPHVACAATSLAFILDALL